MWLRLEKLCFFLFLLSFLSIAAYGQEIPKDHWIDTMSTLLPVEFCKPTTYFRECFEISQEECEEVVGSAARVCLNKFKKEIPDAISSREESADWGEVVGECAGGILEITFIEQRIDSEKCKDLDNWR